METMGFFESRKKFTRSTYVFALSEPICDEGRLLNEICDPFLDLCLLAIELRVQFSQAFHLAHLRDRFGSGCSGYRRAQEIIRSLKLTL